MGNSKSKKRIAYSETNIIHKEKIYDKKTNILLKFRGKTYNVVCDRNESFSSIFEKLKNRIGVKDQNLNFTLNGEKINSEMKLDDSNSISIEAYETNTAVGGLYPVNFTDVRKQVHEEHYFSDTAPNYRTVTKGINIYGICKGNNCKAYGKEVVVPQKKKKKFDLIKEKDNLECPECKGVVIPKTLGFHLCKYKVSGKVFLNDIIEPFEFEGKAENENSVQYFNPDENGEVMVVELKIEVEYL